MVAPTRSSFDHASTDSEPTHCGAGGAPRHARLAIDALMEAEVTALGAAPHEGTPDPYIVAGPFCCEKGAEERRRDTQPIPGQGAQPFRRIDNTRKGPNRVADMNECERQPGESAIFDAVDCRTFMMRRHGTSRQSGGGRIVWGTWHPDRARPIE